MDWRFDGVPLSTTTTAPVPKAAPILHSLSAPASGIRAPLSLLDESDFEHASSYYSSDGYVSGEGEQEDDVPGEEIVQETLFVKEYAFSRPNEKTPHGDVVQESSTSSTKNGISAFSKPNVKSPQGDVVQESSTSGIGITKNGISAFSRPNEDVVQESSGVIAKNGVSGDGSSSSSSSVSSIVSGNAFSRPYIRSMVSSDSSEFTDSDEDDSDVVEDDSDAEYGSSSSRPLVDVESEEVVEKEPSGVVSVGVGSLPVSLRPIALISGDSEDDDDESQGSEAMEDDGFSGAVVRVPSIEVLTGIVDSPKVRILDVDDMGGDKVEGVSAAERMLVLGQEGEKGEILGEETVLETDVRIDEGPLGFTEERASASLAVNGETRCISESASNADLMHIDAGRIDDGNEHLEPVGEPNDGVVCVGLAEESRFSHQQVGEMELEVAEYESSISCLDMENATLEIRGTDQEDNSADSESDFPEISEFSECLVETEQVNNMLDRHEETGVSTLDMELGHEINIEAKDDELLFVEAENSLLPSKSMAAEVEMEHMSVSQSGGEIVDKSVSDVEGRDTIDSSVIQLSPLEIDCSLPVHEARSPVLFAPLTPNVESEQPLGEREHRKRLEQMPHLLYLHRLSSGSQSSLAAEVAEEKQPTSAKGDGDSSLNILVIGKTGVGKSATINSIFGETKMLTDAFKPATPIVKEVSGTIDGVKVKVLDTPGLRTDLCGQSINRKILLSIKKQIKKSPPDVVLYMDRLDMQTSEIIDLPLIRSITTYLGSWVWHKSVIVLTHAKSLPPDRPDGTQLDMDLFVAQRLHGLRRMISRSAVDQTNIGAMVPVSLVENHPFYKTNESGESWELPLLFLCHSMKILSELDSAPATGGCLIRFMRWSCDLVCRLNLQSVFRVDAETKQRIWAELNKKLSSEMSLDTSNQLQLASLVLVAVANVIVLRIFS